MRHDVTFPLYVEVDEIYNLACPASPDPLPARPGADDQDQRARRDQHAGPRQAGQGADPAGLDQRGLRRPEVHPQTEDYWGHVNPIGIRACYDEGKRCAETLFFDYRRQHDLDIKVVRIFNTYGPRMHPNDGRVVSATSSCRRCAAQPITIYGDGEQTRSFCYVDDLIDGMVRLMDTRRPFTGPVNLGNPAEFTMLELADSRDRAHRLATSEIVFKALPSTTRASGSPTSP